MNAESEALGFSCYEDLLVARLLRRDRRLYLAEPGDLDNVNFFFQAMVEFRRIVDEIERIGDGALPEVRRALNSSQHRVVYCACEVLARLPCTDAIVDLLSLIEHPNSLIRRAVAEALGATGDASAIDGLVRLTRDDDSLVANAALSAIARQGVAMATAHLESSAGHRDPVVRMHATKLISQNIPASAIPLLVEKLADKQWGVAFYASKGLKKLPELAATPVLYALETHGRGKGPYLRQFAIPLLAQWKEHRATPVICAHMASTGNQEVRVLAAEALGRLGDSGSVPTLIDALKWRPYKVRIAVSNALARLRAREAVPNLIECACDMTVGDDTVWKSVAKLGDESTIPLVEEVLQSEISGSTRYFAEQTLRELTSKARALNMPGRTAARGPKR